MTGTGSNDIPEPPADAASGSEAPLAPGLYVVATPIGNLEDITLRALRILRSVDRIACEDTRQTGKLLNHFGIKKPTVSYHLHNEQGRAGELVQTLRAGERLAVVSDAGMPGIADPGEALVRAALHAGVTVIPIPGANAALTALIAGGLSAESFAFSGFLPARSGHRRTALEQLRGTMTSNAVASTSPTQIFYEAPHRLLETLGDLVAIFGPGHRVVVARELTKLHEEILRGTAAEVFAELQRRDVVRGEIVLLLDGQISSPHQQPGTADPRILAEAVRQAMREGLSEKDALKRVAKARGLGKSDAYREWQRSGRR